MLIIQPFTLVFFPTEWVELMLHALSVNCTSNESTTFDDRDSKDNDTGNSNGPEALVNLNDYV